MKRLYPFIVFIFIKSFSFSQNRMFDSLLNILKTSKEDTNKVKTLNTCASSIAFENPDSSIIFAEKALQLSIKCHWGKGTIVSYNLMGTSFFNKSDFDKAIKNFNLALDLVNKHKLYRMIPTTYNGIGSSYLYKGDYPKALDFFFKTLKSATEYNVQDYVALSNVNIANVFMIQKETQKSLDYNFKALKIAEEMNDDVLKDKIYYALGTCYASDNSKDSISRTEEALQYFLICLKINEKLKNKSGLAYAYSAIGSCFERLNKHKEALINFQKASEIAISIGDKRVQISNISTMAFVYKTIKQYQKAIENYTKTIKLSREIGSKDIELDALAELTQIYKAINKNDKALSTYEEYVILRDTMTNQEKGKEIVRKEMNFEFDKKQSEQKIKAEAQQAIANEQKKRQEYIIYSVAGLLVLVIIFAGFMFNRFKITQKQKTVIELKERVTQEQKHIIEEKHKEITDSINYAERIQRSFIATKEILNENLKDYFVFFLPKDVVSGDFYWASKLSNGNFALATADSTGHGVPGAIMSLLNITSLEKAIETCTQPAHILNSTRKTIIERLKKDGSAEGGKDGMDASLTVYDFKNNKLIIAAANNPVWIVRGSEVIDIKADKMPVGKHDKDSVSFSQQEIDLQKGDVVYTLTDGFPDQFGGEKGKKFMSKNLRELLCANAHLPMLEQKALLELTFKNWVGNLEQVDDVTLFGVRV